MPDIEDEYEDEINDYDFEVNEEEDDWVEHDKPVKNECTGIVKVKSAIMTYEIYSGSDKDYYLSLSTKILNQNFNLYKKVLIGDQYEEMARIALRNINVSNPTKNRLANAINDRLRAQLEDMCYKIINTEKQPETWID